MLLPTMVESIIDDQTRTALTNDYFHYRRSATVQGFFPDWGTSDKEYITPYVSYADDADQDLISVPTSTLVGNLFGYFPELVVATDWRALLQESRYYQWAREEIRRPVVSLNSGFSLVNFLLEWKESQHLIASWLSKRHLIERWHAVMKSNRSLPARLQAIANERLAHVYGTKLFLADAFRIYRILQSWRERADRFLANAGGLLRYYKEPLRLEREPYLVRRIDYPVFTSTNSKVRLMRTQTVDCHARIGYTYTVKELKGFIARLAQLSDAFGVNLDVGIAWDAIPLTFVVDWFVNISELMHRYANYGDWNKVDIRFYDYGHSAKVQDVMSLIWQRDIFNPGIPGKFLDSTEIYNISTSVYRRQRDSLPPLQSVKLTVTKDPWRVNRVINLAALVVQYSKLPGRKFGPRVLYERKRVKQ
jgi:hypothetical protein